jgi:hypothetical protein
MAEEMDRDLGENIKDNRLDPATNRQYNRKIENFKSWVLSGHPTKLLR